MLSFLGKEMRANSYNKSNKMDFIAITLMEKVKPMKIGSSLSVFLHGILYKTNLNKNQKNMPHHADHSISTSNDKVQYVTAKGMQDVVLNTMVDLAIII